LTMQIQRLYFDSVRCLVVVSLALTASETTTRQRTLSK